MSFNRLNAVTIVDGQGRLRLIFSIEVYLVEGDVSASFAFVKRCIPPPSLKVEDLFVLTLQRGRFLKELEDCSCFFQLMGLDLVSLQLRLFRLRVFKQNCDYHNQNFALLLEA